MMKINNKQFFNRKILMTLVVGTNVICGGHSGICRTTAEIYFR